MTDGVEPRLARITVYPVKSLDGLDRDRTGFAGEGLELDRAYALVDENGNYVNGKRERAVHRLESAFDPETRTLRLSAPGQGTRTFTLPEPTAEARDAGTAGGDDALTAWLSGYFGYPVSLRDDDAGGFPDDTAAAGPTVISTATIREVASWFPTIDADGMRRRLRANLEIGGVPAFWEDRLFADRDHVVRFCIGEVRFAGVNPCQRCVVPSRHPDTGEEAERFRERFVERRRETMPPWSGGDWFGHHFRLMVNTRLDEGGEREVAVGDPVRVEETRPA
jgi:uncharacterized protein YcbX